MQISLIHRKALICCTAMYSLCSRFILHLDVLSVARVLCGLRGLWPLKGIFDNIRVLDSLIVRLEGCKNGTFKLRRSTVVSQTSILFGWPPREKQSLLPRRQLERNGCWTRILSIDLRLIQVPRSLSRQAFVTWTLCVADGYVSQASEREGRSLRC
jgi:hypothetical protein